VHPGTIVFCNANPPRCEDSAILGQAQLTSAGSAQIHLRLAVGTYSITAKFQGALHGTPVLASSTSTIVTLTVTGRDATSAVLTTSGVAGNFKFTGTLTAQGVPYQPVCSPSWTRQAATLWLVRLPLAPE
jgi:hypothetical protein